MATLREIRDQLNLTQSEVATKLGITIPSYSNYETGVVLPNLDDILILERNFMQHIDWPDNVTVDDKHEIMEALSVLAENYPLASVLNFAQKYLKEGVRIGRPKQFIIHYMGVAKELNVEPLI
jgi:transcriptional regulator with XRE-family HTH domain